MFAHLCLQVLMTLDQLEKVSSFQEFVHIFSQFGNEMVEFAHLTGDRQNVSAQARATCFWLLIYLTKQFVIKALIYLWYCLFTSVLLQFNSFRGLFVFVFLIIVMLSNYSNSSYLHIGHISTFRKLRENILRFLELMVNLPAFSGLILHDSVAGLVCICLL